MKRVPLSWSSGKDSAWTLHVLRRQRQYDIAGLLATFNQAADRVAMHAVRRELIERQAAAAGLPLWNIPLPWPCSNEQYEVIMAETCARAVAAGIEGVAFGDLFLEDVRAYRENQMKHTGLQPIFPLWGLPTRDLANAMIASGLRAKLTCVDTQKLDASFAGREFDKSLLADLPHEVDPCGEKGEFHSFVYAGPMLSEEIPVLVGEMLYAINLCLRTSTWWRWLLSLCPNSSHEAVLQVISRGFWASDCGRGQFWILEAVDVFHFFRSHSRVWIRQLHAVVREAARQCF